MSKSVLNVGGGSKAIAIPAHYADWRHDLLDIDPAAGPDIVADARDLHRLPGGTYDAIYCSHNLEHYHRHEGAVVVRGFAHMLKPDGFVEVRVPDMRAVMRTVVTANLDIDDVLYESSLGPILVRDVLYGWHVEIEKNDNPYFIHKTGFFAETLCKFMAANGFPHNACGTHQFEIIGFFFKQLPTPEQLTLLRLKRTD